MLVLEPELRYSAQDCYREVSRLPVPSQGRCLTPTPTSYAKGYERPASYCAGQEIKDQSGPVSLNVVRAAEHFDFKLVEQKGNRVRRVPISDGHLADPN